VNTKLASGSPFPLRNGSKKIPMLFATNINRINPSAVLKIVRDADGSTVYIFWTKKQFPQDFL